LAVIDRRYTTGGTSAALDHGLAMISLLKKTLWLLIAASGPASVACGQSGFFEVVSTPYDHQMKRVQPTLTEPSAYALYGPSLTVVNEWMNELRAMPYRYSRQWQTPYEVEFAKVGDCKGKAMVLYDWMQLNGATNVRLVIGKRREGDSLTHAWLEWQTRIGTLLLDPTFNWNAAIKLKNRRSYIAFYGYEGRHKFQAADSFLVNRATATPAAPAHGVAGRPLRSASRLRSNSWRLEQAPMDARYFWNRPTL
jgi:hypothetical protein